MKTVEILKAAKELLVTKGWTQGTCSRDAEGLPVPLGPKATCFCTVGALWSVVPITSPAAVAAEMAIKQAAHPELATRSWAIGSWNDDPDRTAEEVLAVFDKAIAAEEAKDMEPVTSEQPGVAA